MRRLASSTMSRILSRSAALRALPRPQPRGPVVHSRPLFGFGIAKRREEQIRTPPIPDKELALEQDDLFHPLSESPFEDLRARAERVKMYSVCPISAEKYGERVRPSFDCPDCGWPTHKNRERWEEDKENHAEFCGRLREVNEEEHDLRSGRYFPEFSIPTVQPYDQAVAFTNWDTFFFTRDFPSIDSERSVRHVVKVLTYPITIAAVLHQGGPYHRGNGRITREGRRNMVALHSTLHLPPGGHESSTRYRPQPPVRIFILGAQMESALPPHYWEQFNYMFPRSYFMIYFVGPDVQLPILDPFDPRRLKRPYMFSMDEGYGHPSYKVHVSTDLTITCVRAAWEDVHDLLGPFDPYVDVFFSFSPGLGFPDQPGAMNRNRTSINQGVKVPIDEETPTKSDVALQPLVQAQTGWKPALQKILETKCGLFFTAYSPLDMQRDVAALYGSQPPSFRDYAPVKEFPDYVPLPTAPTDPIEGVTDEFEMILTPGKNIFGSHKWEIAEWDPRVAIRSNWGIWGIRGKRYDITEAE